MPGLSRAEREHILRAEHYLGLWAQWMRQEHASTIAQMHGIRFSQDFEGMCNAADNAACRACDACIADLGGIERQEIHHAYLGSRRHLHGTDDLLRSALEAVGLAMLRKGFP